jgi:alkylhydroperoxidase family enzyme
LRELIILQTSRLFHAEYVWEQHREISEAIGVSEDQRKALDLGDLTSGVFSEKERVLLEFISQISTTLSLSSAQFAKLREFFSEQEIVEIIGVYGFAYTVAALASILCVEVDPVSGSDMLSFVDAIGRNAR